MGSEIAENPKPVARHHDGALHRVAAENSAPGSDNGAYNKATRANPDTAKPIPAKFDSKGGIIFGGENSRTGEGDFRETQRRQPTTGNGDFQETKRPQPITGKGDFEDLMQQQ